MTRNGPTAHFLLSTGRVSTQSLAATISAARPEAVVDHEALGPHFASRRVFRQPDRCDKVLANNPSIASHWDAIEAHLDAGRDYFELGWTAFGWIPYLAKRFEGRFSFAHLIRNPFHTAASHSTHLLFRQAGADTAYQKRCVLHPGDPGTCAPNYWGDQVPSAFEWALFQWLEINRYGQALSGLHGFKGLWKFEDIYGSGPTNFLPDFCEVSSGASIAKIDRAHAINPDQIGKIHPNLLIDVTALACDLGYREADVLNAFNASDLSQRYSQSRL